MNPICWLTRRRLGAYGDGELGRIARAKVESHVARCAGCAAALRALDRLRALLRAPAAVPDLPGPVWEAFWPQVRGRLGAPAPARESRRAPAWAAFLAGPRLPVTAAVAGAAVLVGVAVWGPWSLAPAPPRPGAPVASAPAVTPGPAPRPAPKLTAAAHLPQAVVQSVEMADPRSSLVIFTPARTEMTVVWVFGLEPTGGQ